MKDLFSPDSHWHDLGEVKYELLFPRRLLQFLQHDDFPKALSKLECGTYLLFPEQQGEQSGLAAPLDEPDWDGNGSGATAGGISWEFTPCNRAGQHSQEGEGEATVYFWIQRFILAIGALLLHAGPEGDLRVREEQDWRGSAVPLLEGNLSRKAAQWLEGWFQFPNCQCAYKMSSAHWNCLLRIFHSILPRHILSNSRFFSQNRFVKKLRLFLSQVPCF